MKEFTFRLLMNISGGITHTSEYTVEAPTYEVAFKKLTGNPFENMINDFFVRDLNENISIKVFSKEIPE